MENFTSYNLRECLKTGREIEFTYQKGRYSITNSDGFWYLCCDTENKSTIIQKLCPYDELELLSAQVDTIFINGVKLSDIFDYALYSPLSLQIL